MQNAPKIWNNKKNKNQLIKNMMINRHYAVWRAKQLKTQLTKRSLTRMLD